jgi:potassium/hydrogen antiporter
VAGALATRRAAPRDVGGLKGAVPILLATLALLSGVEGGTRLYGIVFVVVAFSVVVQGTSIPLVAAKLGVPLRAIELRAVEHLHTSAK